MKLIEASQAEIYDLKFLVRSVRVVKLFYVTTGRNAWWSTWITRYSQGCMHSTLESARAFCESRRVQGTVFYIDELPSLAFLTHSSALVISEINTEAFLCRLDLKRLSSITTVFPVSIMSLRQLTYVFRPQSPLWPADYPEKDSAILSFCAAPSTLAELARSDQLSSFASISNGPNYSLSWSTRPFSKDCFSLHAIASSLAGRMGDT